MNNVLIHTILMFMLVLSVCNDSIGQKIHTYTAITPFPTSQEQTYLSSASIDPISFLLEQQTKMIPSCAATQAKTLSVNAWVTLRPGNNGQFPFLHFLPDWYFHPFPTLGKTKYYVFALGEIIV